MLHPSLFYHFHQKRDSSRLHKSPWLCPSDQKGESEIHIRLSWGPVEPAGTEVHIKEHTWESSSLSLPLLECQPSSFQEKPGKLGPLFSNSRSLEIGSDLVWSLYSLIPVHPSWTLSWYNYWLIPVALWVDLPWLRLRNPIPVSSEFSADRIQPSCLHFVFVFLPSSPSSLFFRNSLSPSLSLFLF